MTSTGVECRPCDLCVLVALAQIRADCLVQLVIFRASDRAF
jgi:hypothetical protein